MSEVVGLYVRDQDEALAFYVEKVGFRVHTDVRNGDYRWLTVQHPDQPSFQLGLFKPGPPVIDAATAQALNAIVAKGAMPPLVLVVDDCRAAYDATARARRGVHAGAGRPLRHRGRRLPRSVRQRLEDDRGAAGALMARELLRSHTRHGGEHVMTGSTLDPDDFTVAPAEKIPAGHVQISGSATSARIRPGSTIRKQAIRMAPVARRSRGTRFPPIVWTRSR